ncbi:MAG: hypothetical protein IJP89_06440 [Synergistaceae bacterium]|nr:hypothetical protein [Synergistaceae bacterium]MBR0257549.1 hypothetical protein [Synergistaceae bacterium]
MVVLDMFDIHIPTHLPARVRRILRRDLGEALRIATKYKAGTWGMEVLRECGYISEWGSSDFYSIVEGRKQI